PRRESVAVPSLIRLGLWRSAVGAHLIVLTPDLPLRMAVVAGTDESERGVHDLLYEEWRHEIQPHELVSLPWVVGHDRDTFPAELLTERDARVLVLDQDHI